MALQHTTRTRWGREDADAVFHLSAPSTPRFSRKARGLIVSQYNFEEVGLFRLFGLRILARMQSKLDLHHASILRCSALVSMPCGLILRQNYGKIRAGGVHVLFLAPTWSRYGEAVHDKRISSPRAPRFAALAPFAVLGGGGGFLQVEVKVSPGEKLLVLVGGGGGASHGEAGGAGGFNGGQAGGLVPALPTPPPARE